MKSQVLSAVLLASAIPARAQLFQNLSSLSPRVPVGNQSGTTPGLRTDGPKWLCSADFDGDGHLDLATTHLNGVVSVVWGNGQRQFTPPQILTSGLATLRGISCGDFNNDGRPDLLAAAQVEGKLALWLQTGGRTFAPVALVTTFPGARNVAKGDFDGDGTADLAAAGPNLPAGYAVPPQGGPALVVPPAPSADGLVQLRGNGAGGFTQVTTLPALATQADIYEPFRPLYSMRAFRPAGATADWLAVTHAESRELWWLQPIAGQLTVAGSVALFPATAEQGTGVRAVLTGSVTAQSGALDLITANSETGTVEVRSAVPGASFSGWESTPAQTLNIPGGPRSMELSDLNGDGWLDLVVAVRNADRIIIYRNNAGTLEQSSISPTGISPREMAAGDFNEDGYTDFAVVNRYTYDVTILNGAPPRPDNIISFQALDQIYAVDGEVAALQLQNVNGDSRDDVIQLHRASGEVSVRISGANGLLGSPTFYPMGTRPNALAIVDYDRDGQLDLVTANLGDASTAGASAFRKGLGNGTFGPLSEVRIDSELTRLGISQSQAGSLYGIEYGDLDGDGIEDAIAGFIDCRILFYKGLPNGTMQLVTPNGGLDHIFIMFIFEARGFAIADFDQDGDKDIAAVGMYGELGTIENKGDLLSPARGPLTIRKYGLANAVSNPAWYNARSMIVRDVDNDGDPDLIAGLQAGSVLFKGTTGMDFIVGQPWSASVPPPRSFAAPSVTFPVSSMAEGDFDGNGVTDLALACDVERCVQILVRNNVGGWDPAIRVAAPSAAYLASGDIDGDGKADLAGTGDVLWVALSGRPAGAGAPLTNTFARPGVSHPVINEIMAQNSSITVTAPNTVIDPADNPDYIEIYHGGTGTQLLGGWSLRLVGSAVPRVYSFPPKASLSPADPRLIIRCSSASADGVPDVWRTGWALPEGGATLCLCDAAGNILDTVVYPKQLRDVSYGRYKDGLSGFVYNVLPDPGRANVDNGPVAPRIDFDGFRASTYGPGMSTVFRCECRDDTAPVACSLVWWRTDIADHSKHRVLLYDDGLHDDGAMLDANWSGRLTPPLPAGAQIEFYLEASDLNNATAYLPADPASVNDDDAASTPFFKLAITAPVPSLEISEVVTRNKRIVVPGQAGSPDYFEIRNTGTSAADLTGMGLTSKLFEEAPRFLFPDGTILPPGGTTLVMATGFDAVPGHAPFTLDPEGGTYYLFRNPANPANGIGFLDRVVIPALKKNQAWFRLGARGPWAAGDPTPGGANLSALSGLMLTTAIDDDHIPRLTVAAPTTAGQPWSIQSSADLRTWSTVRSGTGNGTEQSLLIAPDQRRGFFRAP